jgi:hypothetical protein
MRSMTGNPSPRMMTEAEVGAYLRMSPDEVLGLVELRQLEAHVLSCRVVRFTESAVEEYRRAAAPEWASEPVSEPLEGEEPEPPTGERPPAVV